MGQVKVFSAFTLFYNKKNCYSGLVSLERTKTTYSTGEK
jgi:hypothetical protein